MRTTSDVDSAGCAINCRQIDALTTVVVPSGNLDLASAPELKATLRELLDAGTLRFVLDLSRVSFIDSTALGTLISFKLSLGSRGGIAIAAPSAVVVALLELTGVERILDLFPDVEAAAAFVRELVSGVEPGLGGVGGDAVDATERRAAPGERVGVVREDVVPGASLTADAAMVLGIAATAMPFARSSREEAERWLRILSRHGDAGSVLSSLGFTEDSEPPGDPVEDPSGRASGSAVDLHAVSAVTRCAGFAVDRRGASRIRPSDLLEGVIEVYGVEFERVLMLHGIERADVLERLHELRSPS